MSKTKALPKAEKKEEVIEAVAVPYKDAASSKPYASKEAFLAVKLKSKGSKFTLLYGVEKEKIESNVPDASVDILRDTGKPYVDPRLAKKVKDLIPGGENYFIRDAVIREIGKTDNSGGVTSGLVSFRLERKPDATK